MPLILVNRFRGTMDHWDPALLEVLASERRVIHFDNVGMARSTGETPKTLAGFAKATATFIRAYLARLDLRKDAFVRQVEPAAIQAQITAGNDISTPESSLLPKLKRLTQPVLVANGDDDIMIPTYRSYVMAQALPNAKLVIYPDSGHGFLFQYAKAFGREVVEFLRG